MMSSVYFTVRSLIRRSATQFSAGFNRKTYAGRHSFQVLHSTGLVFSQPALELYIQVAYPRVYDVSYRVLRLSRDFVLRPVVQRGN